jgi:molybdopterin synthase catalytic subunit
LFQITDEIIATDELRNSVADPGAGGFCVFEGWVRNENEGQDVARLEYEVYVPLATKEGARVLQEAQRKFPYRKAACVHRSGLLEIGDCAVWVGVSAAHRDEAFKACRYIIDEIKHCLPIWKKEHYVDGDSFWVNCERCAAAGKSVE